MQRRNILLALSLYCLVLVPLTMAQAEESCTTLQYPANDNSPQQLHAIAEQCKSQTFADLFYNRAQHLELIATHRELNKLASHSATHVRQQDIETYRFYMALLEIITTHMKLDPLEQAKVLNAQYAQLNELTELRINGFDRIADRKERELFTQLK